MVFSHSALASHTGIVELHSFTSKSKKKGENSLNYYSFMDSSDQFFHMFVSVRYLTFHYFVLFCFIFFHFSLRILRESRGKPFYFSVQDVN